MKVVTDIDDNLYTRLFNNGDIDALYISSSAFFKVLSASIIEADKAESEEMNDKWI